MSPLSARDVTVRRSGRAILKDVSVALPAGAFVAVIGANGAGKSTLLSVLAGLLKPDQGEALLDGQSLSTIDRKALARRRAYLPQTPRCEWPISVERLVALGLTPSLPAFGALPLGLQERVDKALQALDLNDRRAQAATTLSGGELARAMLARAVVGDPQVLILDEPIAGLDPKHALDAMGRLQGFAQAGQLVIAAVHDLVLAARFTTHVLALKEGCVLAFGPTPQILTAPLIRDAFQVQARVSGEGQNAVIDVFAATQS